MIQYPRLYVNREIVHKNISAMAGKAKRGGLDFRPHFKTHQSREIGKWFGEYGVSAITVSSTDMAEYFARDGWKDITIAFPVNYSEIKRIDGLAARISLTTLAISVESVRKLSSSISNKIGLYIEIDSGTGRSGIPVDNAVQIKTIQKEIEAASNLEFKGFYCHAGHTYKARSEHEIREIAEKVLVKLGRLKEQYPEAHICYGDTPSCSVLDDFGPVSQLSPGNFVFYDWMQVVIGSCTPGQIAVAVECSIAGRFPERNQLLIHGGAIHFSKDFIEYEDGSKNFGTTVTKNSDNWPNTMLNSQLASLSQEHGIVNASRDLMQSKQPGDTVFVYPIHSCLTANLMANYHEWKTKQVIDHMNQRAPR